MDRERPKEVHKSICAIYIYILYIYIYICIYTFNRLGHREHREYRDRSALEYICVCVL